jgi:ribonuclease BN (tRNA processing enzyme)
VGPFEVTPIEVEHPVHAHGLRVSADDRTVGYSGDTGPCAGLDEVAAGVDLFLAEASFLSGNDNPPALHLTGTEAGDCATRSGARELVLTHVPPWFDPELALEEARAAYDGPLRLARAGEVYEL